MGEDGRISSRQNERVKRAIKLRKRKGRGQQNRTLIDGTRELMRALAAGVEIDEAFVCEGLCEHANLAPLLGQLRRSPAPVWSVTTDVFARLAFGDRQEGVVAAVRPPGRSLAQIQLPAQPLVAVLEGIEKPGNVGAILRSADAAGVAALVVADGGTDLYNPAAIRASLGTIFHIPVCAASTKQTRAWLAAHALPVYAARPDGQHLHTGVDFRAGAAVVLGSEATGLSAVWQSPPCQGIRLPQLGVADSLNVAAAAAVIFYEALRQRS